MLGEISSNLEGNGNQLRSVDYTEELGDDINFHINLTVYHTKEIANWVWSIGQTNIFIQYSLI